MSEEQAKKAGRGRKKRMYNNFDNTEQAHENIKDETKAESAKEEKKQTTSQSENIREVDPENMVIELVEDLKFKGSLLTDEKQKELQRLINKNMVYSMGLSFVPVPMLDSFLVSAIQLKVIREISMLYGIPFYRDAVKAYIGSVFSMIGYDLGTELLKSFVRKIPIIGTASALVSPVVAAASTYAIAKVFIYHYELGGDLLNFKPEKVRSYFAKQFEDGKTKLYRMKKDTSFAN